MSSHKSCVISVFDLPSICLRQIGIGHKKKEIFITKGRIISAVPPLFRNIISALNIKQAPKQPSKNAFPVISQPRITFSVRGTFFYSSFSSPYEITYDYIFFYTKEQYHVKIYFIHFIKRRIYIWKTAICST